MHTHNYTIRGLKLCVRTGGNAHATALVLLHGLFDTGYSFAPLVAALQQHNASAYAFFAPDWRGHGDSAPATQGYWFPDYLADLDALLQHISPGQPVILVGHSMGGQVASMYAGARPEAVSHLITLDSLNVPDAPVMHTAERYRRWLDGLQRQHTAHTYTSPAIVAKRIGQRYPELDAEQRAFLAHSWTRPTADGRVRLAVDPHHRLPFPYGFRAEEAKALWRSVRAPTLCLDAEYGLSTRAINADTMAARRSCFHDMTHMTISDCGHMLHVQQPTLVAGAIQRFLDSRS